MIYFTADTHFFHENIIKYTNRPFQSVKEMNNVIKKGISLTKDDILIHLGDIAFSNFEYLNFLKEHKENILIKGNHDKKTDILKKVFTQIYKNHYIMYNGIKIELVHHPDLQNGDADLTLCGHIHNNWLYKKPNDNYEYLRKNQKEKDRYVFKVLTINLAVELWDYKAVSIKRLFEFIKEKELCQFIKNI